MSNILTLSDGNISVLLRSCKSDSGGSDQLTYFNLLRDGHKPQVATRLENGTYAPVTETYKLIFKSTTDSERVTVLQYLIRLKERVNHRKQVGMVGNRVWLIAQTPTEANPRYAIVEDIIIPELDHRHWRTSPSKVRIIIQIVRHGAWRDTLPNNGFTNKIVEGTTIQNRKDSTGNNRIHIPNTDVEGDLPVLTRIERIDGIEGTQKPAHWVKTWHKPNQSPKL